MPTNKHTPGPWHVGDTNNNFSPKVYAPDGYMVADAAISCKRTEDECIENARLIAAAPDLLEALIWLRNQVGTTLQGNISIFGYGKVTEAILKATKE